MDISITWTVNEERDRDPRDAVQYRHVLYNFKLSRCSNTLNLGAEHESTRTVLAGFTGTPVSLSDVHW